jgi:hypothetical protein
MDQEPCLVAILPPDLEELIGQPAAGTGGSHDLLQLFVEAFVAAGPIQVAVDGRVEERQKGRQEMFERFFPGAIPIDRGSSWRGHAGLHRSKGRTGRTRRTGHKGCVARDATR